MGPGPRLIVEDGKTIGFGHGGANEGYRCDSIAFLDGRGAVVATNSDSGDSLLAEILAAAAQVYQWPAKQPETLECWHWMVMSYAEFPGLYILEDGDNRYETKVELNDAGLDISSIWFPTPNTFF